MMKRLAYGLVVLACSGCTAADGGAEREQSTADSGAGWSLRSIGVLESSEELGTFDAVGAASQAILVADASNGKLHSFDRTGTPQGSSGRKGQGPGEMLLPAAVVTVGDTLTVVLDQRNAKLVLLSLASPTPAHLRDVPLPVPAMAMCAMDGRLFVSAIAGGKLVHELSWDGRVLSSFGALHSEDRATVPYELLGPLMCGIDRIVHVASALGVIRTFDMKGAEVGTDTIADFERAVFVRDGPGVRVQAGPSGRTEWVRSGVLVDSLIVLTTELVRRRGESPQAEPTQLRVFSRSGLELWSTSAGRVIGSRGDTVWIQEETLNPELGTYLLDRPAR